MSHIYGKPHTKIETDVVDRIGLRTLVLSKMWAPSRGDLSQEEIDAEAPDIPPVPGGVLLIGEQTRQASGGLRTTWTFEGIKGNGKTVTFRGRKDSLDYGFEPGFAQVSIKRHPHFRELLDYYGGVFDNEGNVIWPVEIPPAGAAGGGQGLLGQAGPLGSGGLGSGGPVLLNSTRIGGSASGGPNPMFGIEDFFRMEGSYRFRYAATALPVDLHKGVERSMPSSALPGEVPDYPDRDWLKLPVMWRRRGFIYEIIEMYWLSGEGGWPAPVYSGRFRR